MTENNTENYIAEEALLFGKKDSDKIFIVALMIECVILALHILLNTVFFSCVIVSGSSMTSTLVNGDVLIMSLKAEPERGNVVVIDGEKEVAGGYEWIIKRVIAVGGDTIDIRDGKVYLMKAGESDYVLLEEPYLDDWQKTEKFVGADCEIKAYPFVVPEGEYYFLGDNRIGSMDSRSKFGTCKKEQIVGVVKDGAIKSKGFLTGINKLSLKIKGFFVGDKNK